MEAFSHDGFEVAERKADLFQRSDVLRLHVQLMKETRGIVTMADLAMMKPSSLLVNTSRAGLIERGTLEQALLSRRPGSAAVDVYEEELVKDHPLLYRDNVICTPHLGYVERDNYEVYFGPLFDQLMAFVAGGPIDIINPQ
jgi:D-3-phosphoglycerate dehydrogenase